MTTTQQEKISKKGCSLHFLWWSLFVLLADQWSKNWAVDTLVKYQPEPVIDHLNWYLAYNKGAAFSFLSHAGDLGRYFLIIVAIAVVIMLLVWLYQLPKSDWWHGVAYASIVGGAVGNLYDRIVHGHVVDFIDFYVGDWHWPAFNLADSAITLGVIMLLVELVRPRELPKE